MMRTTCWRRLRSIESFRDARLGDGGSICRRKGTTPTTTATPETASTPKATTTAIRHFVIDITTPSHVIVVVRWVISATAVVVGLVVVASISVVVTGFGRTMVVVVGMMTRSLPFHL